MKVVVKEAGKDPVTREVTGDLECLQTIVGGYIELVAQIPIIGVVVYGNEEARLMDPEPPPNFRKPWGGEVILGTVVAVQIDEEGESVTMTDVTARHVVACLMAMADPESLRA